MIRGSLVQNYHDTIDEEPITPEVASEIIRGEWTTRPTYADTTAEE